uniref:Uncharacterized protein n=1 Tax=Aegilops tauschii subsp. strangulata TaxID=200361 RepID=A0A453PBG6_AEGTS
GAFTLDWSAVSSFLFSPLISPFFATANIFVGYFCFLYVLVPTAYWGMNLYNAKTFPIFSSHLFMSSSRCLMGSASPPLPPPSRTSASSTGSKCSQLSVVVLLPDSIVNDSVPHPLHRPKGPGSAPMVGPPLRLWHGLCLHAPHKHHYCNH